MYIPKKIKVGYDERSDTYTGKLAYVIYYDERGKLRKETSWNNWRDNNIEPDDFDNEPIEGFVLNRRAGGIEKQWGWNARKTYCRVYDPRGFEFEIDISNLLWILEHCNSIKGKGLDGKFVYGWDGKELVLVPVDSPDYKEYAAISKTVNQNETIKAKDLKIGATYIDRKDREYIYMGKFTKWTNNGYKSVDGKTFVTYKQLCEYYDENNLKLLLNMECNYKSSVAASCGNYYWFYSNSFELFESYKSLGRKFIKCTDENCNKDYSNIYCKIEQNPEFSPIDNERIEYKYYTFEEFCVCCTHYWNDFIVNINGIMSTVETWTVKEEEDEIQIRFPRYEYKKIKEILDLNEGESVSIKTVFDKLKPMYRQIYLKNGKEYQRSVHVYVE